MEALEPGGARQLDDAQGEEWFDWFNRAVPWNWMRIDWNRVEVFRRVKTASVLDSLRELGIPDENSQVLILWDEASLPVVETNLENVLRHIADVTAVSVDTWIVDSQRRFVLEHYHEDGWDDHTLALVPGTRV